MGEQPEGFAGVSAAGLALGFDGVQPGEELSRGGGTAGVGAGCAHPFGGFVASACPAGNERGVCEDRGAEEGFVGFSSGLEGSDEGVICLLGLLKVEELNSAGQEQRFCEGGGQDPAGDPGGLGEQLVAKPGVLGDGGVELCGLNAPVQTA